MKPLTSRQQLYVTNVLGGLSESQAARKAGYGKAYSYKAAQTIGAIPAVKEAIEKGQAELREKAMYDVEAAVREIDKAISFGYQRLNPMSIAKLLELKAKLYGLLVERVETVTVDISAALASAKARALNVTATIEPLASAYLPAPARPLPTDVEPAQASPREEWNPFTD